MTREDLSPKALEMLNAHNLDEVFITSDAQGFTEKHRAEAHASILKNKKIEHFVKSKEAVAKINDEDIDEYNRRIKETLDASTEAFKNQNEDTDEGDQEDERTKLVAKYELLFNKKPAHNIGTEKLKNQIAEKESELANIEVTVKNTTEPATTVENPTEENKDLNQD